jgi:hypothetical protein
MARNDLVEVNGIIEAETDLAILFDGGWLPKSQIRSREDLKDGTSDIEIPEWLAEQAELI